MIKIINPIANSTSPNFARARKNSLIISPNAYNSSPTLALKEDKMNPLKEIALTKRLQKIIISKSSGTITQAKKNEVTERIRIVKNTICTMLISANISELIFFGLK